MNNSMNQDKENNNKTTDSIFGELIYSYTRAQALADGELVDVSQTAIEAGFRVPVAITRALWAAIVLTALRSAGSKGLHVKQLSSAIGSTPASIGVWLATTGKKFKEIRKVKPGIYALK